MIVDGLAHGRTIYSCAVGDAAATVTAIRKETGDSGLPRCFVRPHTTTSEAGIFDQVSYLLTLPMQVLEEGGLCPVVYPADNK